MQGRVQLQKYCYSYVNSSCFRKKQIIETFSKIYNFFYMPAVYKCKKESNKIKIATVDLIA